jgi:hypothetical protein
MKVGSHVGEHPLDTWFSARALPNCRRALTWATDASSSCCAAPTQ